MEAIRSWWEVPCIAHFCHVFKKPFKLPEFDIEELEDTLLLDQSKDDPTPSLLVEVYCALLNGIVDKNVSAENWEFFLKMHLEWRCEYLKEKWNPHENKDYKDLTTREKVETLHHLCHWRLELDDIGDLLRGVDGPSLRVESLGKSDDGSTYWYFYGTRLYAELRDKKPKKAETSQSTPKGKGRGGKARGNSARKSNVQVQEEEEPNASLDICPTWKVACSSSEEWEELVESLQGGRKQESKRLYNYLNDELLPYVLQEISAKEKMYKKKMLMEVPRRSSDRLALKALQKEEGERQEALEREKQREEQRKFEAEEAARKEEEAIRRRERQREEAIKRRRAREEEQARNRQAEEENWSKALTGELSGRRKAAIGAVQGMDGTQQLFEDIADKEGDLLTTMFKVLTGLRKHEDGWVFEEPVTEDIAPGYGEIIDKPMDYLTIEKKIEKCEYTTKEQFVEDVQLVFENCKEYNGEDSEYYHLANDMLELFDKLMKKNFDDEPFDEDEDEKKKKGTKGGSCSPAHTPDLTSESSSEESSEEDEDESDEDYGAGKKPKKAKKPSQAKELKLPEQLQMHPFAPKMPFGMRPGMMPPHHMYPPGMPPPQMRPPHMPPEMMPYGPHHGYPPFGPQGPPLYPMPMRSPNEPPYLHPDAYQRFPYPPPNGMPFHPPPSYRYPMGPPGHPMMHHRPPMGPPPSGSHMPIHPDAPDYRKDMKAQQPRPPPVLPDSAAAPTEKDADGQTRQISSPRVSSTVETPPSSGDERVHDTDDNRTKENGDKGPADGEESSEETGDKKESGGSSKKTKSDDGEPVSNMKEKGSKDEEGASLRDHLKQPSEPPGVGMRPPMGYRPTHPSSSAPNMNRPPHPMSEQEYRYHQAMMARHYGGRPYPMGPPGYPDDYYMHWHAQRGPPMYPPHPQYPFSVEQQQHIIMAERRRMAAMMEYRARQQAAASAAAAPGGKEPGSKDSKPEGNGGEDIPDYHDSLTRYAMELASTENGEKAGRNSSKQVQEENEGETDKRLNDDVEGGERKPPEEKAEKNGDKNQASSPSQAKPHPYRPHPPPNKHMVHPANGYPSPHGYPAYPPHMYYPPQQMPYYPGGDPSMSRHPMTPEQMERWRYEMQRQHWMTHGGMPSPHPHHQSPQPHSSQAMKRPPPAYTEKQDPSSQPPPAKKAPSEGSSATSTSP